MKKNKLRDESHKDKAVRFKRAAFFLILFVLLMIGYSYFRRENSGLKPGVRAPSFSLASRTGVVTLKDYSGQVVLVNFWATWCPPCASEMPSLERLNQRMSGKKFKILAVSLDEEGWPAIDRFIKKIPLRMTVLMDARGDVASEYGTSFLPESYLIDRQGVIVQKYSGPRDWLDPQIVLEIETYVQK